MKGRERSNAEFESERLCDVSDVFVGMRLEGWADARLDKCAYIALP